MDQITLEKVKECLQKAADELSLELIKVKFDPSGEMGPTLQVLVDKDYQISMKEIEEYTDLVSPRLDEIEGLEENYMLDISSGGSEREIPPSDLPKLVSHYLDVKIKKSGETVTAKLEACDEEKMNLLYFIKGRKKKLELKYEEVESIRMGYKA